MQNGKDAGILLKDYGCKSAAHSLRKFHGTLSWCLSVLSCTRYGRQLLCGGQLACLCHFASGMVVSWPASAILHQVWSSVGVRMCHFASGMVVSWRVCAILHQVWSSVGVCLSHFAPGMVVCWRVYATLHQIFSSLGVFLCHFAPGMVVNWRICAILHHEGRQLACVCAILHHVEWRHFEVGMVVCWTCPFASGMILSWRVFASFWIRYGCQLACLCLLHQVWSSVGVFVLFCIKCGHHKPSVGLFVSFPQVWSLVGVCLSHFASCTVISWRVFLPFRIRCGRLLAYLCRFASAFCVG